jgi:hypothetical protein
MKEQTDYNLSLAAMMGGVSQVMAADANGLKEVGEHLQKLIAIRQLQQKLREEKMNNDLKAAQSFYEKKKLNDQYRAQRPKRITAEKLKETSRSKTPARLSSHQISPVSSRIKWPDLLTTECFARSRTEVERLMAERTAANSGAGTQNCEQIQQAVAQMKSVLRDQVKAITPMEYLAAMKHLDSLAFEARFVLAPSTQAVASK